MRTLPLALVVLAGCAVTPPAPPHTEYSVEATKQLARALCTMVRPEQRPDFCDEEETK